MKPGDQVLQLIRNAAEREHVPPQHHDAVVKATAYTLMAVMNDPNLYHMLAPVASLMEENKNLRAQILQLQRLLVSARKTGVKRAVKKSVAKKAPAKKKAAPRKTVAKKKAAPRKRATKRR